MLVPLVPRVLPFVSFDAMTVGFQEEPVEHCRVADAQRRRVSRLHEWLLHGHSYTFRFDNCDVGKLLHFIAVIATRDRCPPERPFPYAPPLPPSLMPPVIVPRCETKVDLKVLGLEHYESLSAIEDMA
jgi:hypothetical protein